MANTAFDEESVCYFAYGSNMFSRRLQANDRIPSASAVSIASLQGWRLRFNKIGRDRSGKCNIEKTNTPSDLVWGVIYTVPLHEKQGLDRAESLGVGYEEIAVTVRSPDHEIAAFTYSAIMVDDLLRPFQWYRDIVIAGALEHNLPGGYVNQLHAISTDVDPDVVRHQEHQKLLHR